MWRITHKQLEMHGFVHSTVATDALVRKHQAVSFQPADYTCILLNEFRSKPYSKQQYN